MAYTLTQARPLLNVAELELFDKSRTQPVKDLSSTKLVGSVKRARTARDKYRDLFRRQMVGVRNKTPNAITGSDNERTQRKADILQEVLERYEARVALLEARGNSATNNNTINKNKNVNKAASKTAPKVGADRVSLKKITTAPSKTAKGVVKTTADKAGVKAGTTPLPPNKDKTRTKASKSGGTGKKSVGLAQLSSLVGAAAKLISDTEAVRKSKSKNAGRGPTRSPKAPSRKAPTSNNKASAPHINAPLDILPEAKRASPLKQDPTNIAIHGQQSSRGRRTQGKRDSR